MTQSTKVEGVVTLTTGESYFQSNAKAKPNAKLNVAEALNPKPLVEFKLEPGARRPATQPTLQPLTLPANLYEVDKKWVFQPPSAEGMAKAAETLLDRRNTAWAQPAAIRGVQSAWQSRVLEYQQSYNDICQGRTNSTLAIERAQKENAALQAATVDFVFKLLEAEKWQVESTGILPWLLQMALGYLKLTNEHDRLGDKAVYRSLTVFGPRQYALMSDNARAVGRIRHRNTEMLELEGSCVYVGERYFVTAAHVLKTYPSARAYEVQFADANGDMSAPLAFDLKQDFKKPASGGPALDLALCQIAADAVLPLHLKAAKPMAALVGKVEPSLKEMTPVYVIGYPNWSGYTVAIHDDCSVVIPKWVTDDRVKALFFKLTLGDLSEGCTQVTKELSAKVEDRIKGFRSLYGWNPQALETPPASPGYLALMNGSPILGLDSDTKGGDSGGGVFDKASGDLVAIFLGGVKQDKDLPLNRADGSYFEYSLPVETFWPLIETYLNPKSK